MRSFIVCTAHIVVGLKLGMCHVQRRKVYTILAGNMMERYHFKDKMFAFLGCYMEQT